MKKFIPWIVLLALLMAVVPVAAKHARTGDQINILFDPPATYPAGEAFHLAHGWILTKAEKPFGAYTFQLELDGVVVESDFVERSTTGGPGGPSFYRLWVFNFPAGLSGTHTFTGHWMARCQVLVDQGVITGPCADPNAFVDHYSDSITVDFIAP
jgi:hypothetical protein